MVKRDIDDETTDEKEQPSKFQRQWTTMKTLRVISLLDQEEEEANESEDEDDEENVEMPLVRRKRYIRVPHSGKSPHSVAYAANYNERENKGWVKPLYSSIVYRLPVQIAFVFEGEERDKVKYRFLSTGRNIFSGML